MPKPHLSASLTQVQIDEIKSHIAAIKSIFNFGINLTPKEKMKFHKMGPKSVSYVELAYTTAKNHSEIIPMNFQVTEFEKDVKLSSALLEIKVAMSELRESLDDTLCLVGSEAMKQADEVYDIVKISAKRNSALDAIKTELGKRYKALGKGKKGPKQKKDNGEENNNTP